MKRLTVRQIQSLYKYTLKSQSEKRVEVASLIRLSVNADKDTFDKALRSFTPSKRRRKRGDIQSADSGDLANLGLGYQPAARTQNEQPRNSNS